MELEQLAACTTIRIQGPVRLGEVSELLELARAAGDRDLPVELDLGEAEHLHTAAWQVLAALETELRRHGHALRVTRVSDSVRDLVMLLEHNTWLPGEEGTV